MIPSGGEGDQGRSASRHRGEDQVLFAGPADHLEDLPGAGDAGLVGDGVAGLENLDSREAPLLAFLDDHHAATQPLTEDLFQGGGDRKGTLSRADDIDVIEIFQGERKVPHTKNVPHQFDNCVGPQVRRGPRGSRPG